MTHGLSSVQFLDSGVDFAKLPLLLLDKRGYGLGCLASESKRCFVSASSRIERVSVIACARVYTV